MTADFLEEILNEDQRLKNSKGFMNKFLKLPQTKGSLLVHLMPPAPAGMFGRKKSYFFQASRIHKVNNKNFHCPRELQPDGKWIGECPVCDYLRKLWKKSESADSIELKNKLQAEYRKLKANESYYYNVFCAEQNAEEALIYRCPKKVHEKIIRKMAGDKETKQPGLGNVTDRETGRPWHIVVIPTKGSDGSVYPEYGDSNFLDPRPACSPEQWEKIMASLNDLAALRRVVAYDVLKHELDIHLGLVPDDSTAAPSSPVATSTVAVAASVVSSEEPDVALTDDDFLADIKANL